MGLLGSITDAASNAYHKASDTVSKAVDKAEEVVVKAETRVVDTARSEFEQVKGAATSVAHQVERAAGTAVKTVAKAEAKVENFAKSEYAQAKDFVKVTGGRVLQGAESVAESVVSRLPQGVGSPLKGLLEQLEGKRSTVEGGSSAANPNGGDPNQVVDLGDPSKVNEFLATYGQNDRSANTDSDGARCQSNVMVAGLLLRGGVPALKAGLEQARQLARDQLAGATGGRKIALQNAIKNYDAAIAGLASGKPTRGQLDAAADALFHTMAKDAPYDAQGKIGDYKGVSGVDIAAMEGAVGLSDGQEGKEVGEYSTLNPMQLVTDDETEAANNTWEKIKPGETAHVGVALRGEELATQRGPDDEPVQRSSSGRPYYVPKGGGDWVFLDNKNTQDIDHAVLMGRNKDGTRFIYNPLAKPPLMTEKPGDPESTRKLDEMSAKLMGRDHGVVKDDYHSRVTNYSGAAAPTVSGEGGSGGASASSAGGTEGAGGGPG